uniref:Uncharacterized protein n=1 Tax=Pipistrellus kuhlii TaxID=59472 RepID=A0A7J7YXB6_PIPKU|nr:hypothetical protein mPipKuh1_009900 [Pipistrellus kuhlii]
MQAVLYERRPFPLGLIKHQFLVNLGTGGSLKQARSCLRPPCPAEFRNCAYQCDLNEAALQGKLKWACCLSLVLFQVVVIEEGCRALTCEGLFPLGLFSWGTCLTLTVFKVYLKLSYRPPCKKMT